MRLVTGKRAFQRSTAAETLVAISPGNKPKPIGVSKSTTPPLRCVLGNREVSGEKSPIRRYTSPPEISRTGTCSHTRPAYRIGKPVMRVEPRPVQNIPVQRTGVCGARKGSSCQPKKLLLASECDALVTVTGPGGIGKNAPRW